MRYAGLKYNDIVDGEGICVSLWTQGCPFHCNGCHNKQTWSFEGGEEVPDDLPFQIIKAISANGIKRNFSVLGGEPLCPENAEFVANIITKIRTAYPNIKIYVWTGYYLENLSKTKAIESILKNIDVLIDGPYVEKKRDITLSLRGSSNQRILFKGKDF